MAKINFSSLVFFLTVFLCTATVQAQSVESDSIKKGSGKKNTPTDELELQQKVNEKISKTNWVATIKSLDAKRLENLHKWHQFPIDKTTNLEANDSNKKMASAIQTWYNEKPADRAKIILSLE